MLGILERFPRLEAFVSSKKKEQAPAREVVAQFGHLGNKFSVVKEISRKKSAIFSIIDEQQIRQGAIYGWYEEKTSSTVFMSNISRNNFRGSKSHIPDLVGTAIGEIVLQSPKPLLWRSSNILTGGGILMYNSLLESSMTEGSSFYNSLKVIRSDSRFGEGVKTHFTIKKR